MKRKRNIKKSKNKLLFIILILLIISAISSKLYFFTMEINYKREIGDYKQTISKQEEDIHILKQRLNNRQSLNEIDKVAKDLLHMRSNIETIYIEKEKETNLNATK